MTEEQKASYRKAFDLLDKNQDGTISTSELGDAMKATGLNPTEAELEDMIKTVDADKSGTLSFAEFETLMLREVKKSQMEQLREVFRNYDLDNDGTITVKEARQVLKKEFGGKMTDDKIEILLKQMFKETDFNKDDKLKFEG